MPTRVLMVMDLARLAFVTLDVLGICPVVVDAASGAFTVWVRDGIKLRLWSSGNVFVRDILRERARSVS